MNNTILKLENINKYYQQSQQHIDVLKNIDLEVRAGELIGIIGASGSGKSTLLHIAGLLDSASSGKIEIFNKNIEKLNNNDLDQLRLKQIGFVYQYHHLLKDFSASENIMIPMLLIGIKKNEALKRAQDLLEKLGLKSKENNFPGELSGGEQQRVAIARAFANQPTILLADEPTGNLDPATAKEVFDILLKNTKSNNVATIIVTHNHELASRMDIVYELKEGRLVKK